MQMGVEVASVLKPVTAQQRAVLRPIDAATPPPGAVQGTGTVFTLSRNTNASFKALNEALAAGGQASFAKGDIVLSGLDATRAAALARKHAVTMQAVAKAPADASSTKKPRLGLYRPWAPSIDEGWTRWILEDYGFTPVTLRNGDVQAGHLRERFDSILIADASQRSIMEGYAAGTIPGEYAGGIGEPGAEALRNFVREGGTLIAFNNASLFAIEQFHLPVTNLLAGLTPEQFYCSGSLLRVELRDTAHAAVQGLPREPIVMFERGPAFETKSGFRGTVLASYPRDRNPLESGYLLHPERIQGKAAALEVFYGEGRVYLFGFRPQWRGQSHGTYKFFFNAIYDSPASAKPTTAPRPRAASQPATGELARRRGQSPRGSRGDAATEPRVFRRARPGCRRRARQAQRRRGPVRARPHTGSAGHRRRTRRSRPPQGQRPGPRDAPRRHRITHEGNRSHAGRRWTGGALRHRVVVSRQKVNIRLVEHARFLLRSRHLRRKDEALRPLHVLHIEQQDHLARVFHVAHHVSDAEPRRPLRFRVPIEDRLPAIEVRDFVPYQ